MLQNYWAQYPLSIHRYLQNHVASSLARGRVSLIEEENNRDDVATLNGTSRYHRQSHLEFTRFKSLPDLIRDMEQR